MPSYKKSLIFCSLLFILNGCGTKEINLKNNDSQKSTFKKVEIKEFDLEDQYIMFAIESENQRFYYDAKELYLRLFEKTNNYEYLVKYLTLATQLKEYEAVKIKASKYMIENIREEEVILRLYAFSLLKLGEKEEAIINAEKLINLYKNAINYELLGSIYLEDKQYSKSYNAFDSAFNLNGSSTTLLTLTNVQFFSLLQKNEAIKRIEDNIQAKEFDFNLSVQLLAFYDVEKQKEKIIDHLKRMYYYYKMSDNQLLVNKTKALFVKYVVNDNLAFTIDFWEQNGEEDEILLNMYKIANQNQKAYELLKKLYESTNNLDYLAQQAIIEFETAQDKKSVLDSVISKFEKVLAVLDNDIYQNYLAYILIDYDLDVKKGVYLVKKALEKDSSNIAYIDTLAWGEYKLKNCKEAFINMKKVVDEVGLDDAEIKLHWEKIKECKK